MSYDIIKGLNFKNNKVNIKSCCNNLTPHTFTWFECKSLTKLLEEKGKEYVEKIILRHYWNGNFHGGNNIYDKTVKYYKSRLPYTWTNTSESENVGKIKYNNLIEYSYDELDNALYNSLLLFKNRDMSKKWIIKVSGGFLIKTTKTQIYSTYVKQDAKVFKSYVDAWLYYSNGEIVEK